MVSDSVLEEMELARNNHTKWLQRVKRLIENMPIGEGMIPLDPVHSDFGIWFYTKGLEFKELSGLSPTIDNIKNYHEELHTVYIKIYKIYFVDSKRSWVLSKLLSPYKEVSRQEQLLAYTYYEELEEISKQLIKEFDILHRSVRRVDVKILKRALY